MSVSQLPQSIEAEQALLGSMILYNESAKYIQEQALSKDDFFLPANQRLFTTLIDLYQEKQYLDLTMVITRCTDENILNQIGSVSYLYKLTDMAIAPASIKHYVDVITSKASLRRLKSVFEDISKKIEDYSYEPDDILEDAERQISTINRSRRSGDFENSEDMVSELLEHLINLKDNEGITGVPSGFTDLDQITNGFQKGDLIILAARPSVGKTALALNFAINAGVKSAKKTVAIFSLEMPTIQLGKRMLSSLSRVDSSKLNRHISSNSDWNSIDEAAEDLRTSRIYIDAPSGIRTSEIFSKCRKLQSEEGLDLVIIDYLQLITGTRKNASDSRQQEVSDISRNLKQLARELNCPVIALSQLSRGVEKNDKPPVLSDLRESGAIEQDADIVIFLDMKNREDQKKKQVRDMDVYIAKHRNGSTGQIALNFQANYCLFSNSTRQFGGSDNE